MSVKKLLREKLSSSFPFFDELTLKIIDFLWQTSVRIIFAQKLESFKKILRCKIVLLGFDQLSKY